MEEKEDKNAGSFIKYSAIGFQMLVTIGLFAFIGHKLDQNRQNNKPILTAIFSVFGVFIALYQVIKQLNKK